MKKVLLLLLVTITFSSCVSMFMPKKQKITFTTNRSESTTYVDKEEIGKGKLIKEKIKKDGVKQVIVRTPGYKDSYGVLTPSRRPIAYWPLMLLNVFNAFYGVVIDAIPPKNIAYQRALNVDVNDKLVYRGTADKYVDISAINLNIKNKEKDIRSYSVNFSDDPQHLMDNIKEAEKKQSERDAKEELKKAKKKKKGKGNLVEPEDNEIKYEDTKFSYNVYKTLKNTGFVDTVNKFFADFNNSIYLEGSITKLNQYTIYSKRYNNYSKCKLFLTWYIKNNFHEILDSIVTTEFSGDFAVASSYYYSAYSSASDIAKIKEAYLDNVSKMYGDAVDISYLKLHKNPTFTKYLKIENDFNVKDPLLTLAMPKAVIVDKADAGEASVIVKTPEGHGSGFAISQDGYLITNYHVIAGKINNKVNTIKIITSDGQELVGKVVRYNKFRDIALLKVDKTFNKVFKLTNVKSFKNLQDVITIGAPKSVELGQSVSTGVISNERKTNNNNLIQLNMGVNSGNSGGPLFDGTGTLHGVIVSKAIGKNTEGISFAIPGYLVQEYLNINYK